MKTQDKTKPSSSDLRELLRHMDGNDWLTASDLSVVTGWEERFVRKVVSIDSYGAIISGQNGYKITSQSTQEEIDNCIDHLLSREGQLNRRVRILRKYVRENI